MTHKAKNKDIKLAHHCLQLLHLLQLHLPPHLRLLQPLGQDPPKQTTVRLSLASIDRLNDYDW